MHNLITSVFLGLSDGVQVSSYSVRDSGNMSLSYGNTDGVLENRKKFLTGLGIEYRSLVCAQQVHGTNIHYAWEVDCGRGALSLDKVVAGTDGFITDKEGVPVAIFTADCLPVFLFDPERPAIGLIHAGWRSTRAHILTKAVAAMQTHFRTDPRNVRVSFGPALRRCCYEVGEEFSTYFPHDVSAHEEKLYFDIAGANKRELFALGVKQEHVIDNHICTSCHNDKYFSYRKEGQSCGRSMSVFMIR